MYTCVYTYTHSHSGVTCPPLRSIPHGSTSASHYDCGDVVRFHCEPGYALVGPLSISCNETGQWTEQPPSCEGTGFMAYTYTVYTHVYIIIVLYMCVRVHSVLQCSDVPEPKVNSHFCTTSDATPTPISQSSHFLYYCCDVGFRMESGNNGVVECGQEGTWNATSPRCHG